MTTSILAVGGCSSIRVIDGRGGIVDDMRSVFRPSRINPKAGLQSSPIHGRGLYAKEHIAVGEAIVVFGGVYTDAAGAQRGHSQGRLVMQWDDDLYSVEDRGDDPTYFVNHSCDANVWMQDAWTLTARRVIEPGEEINADYALWEADEEYVSKWECRCGTPLCRRRITGKDWHLAVLQERYKGHFSPLLNERIAAFSSRA